MLVLTIDAKIGFETRPEIMHCLSPRSCVMCIILRVSQDTYDQFSRFNARWLGVTNDPRRDVTRYVHRTPIAGDIPTCPGTAKQ